MSLTLIDRLRVAHAQYSELVRQNNFDMRVAIPGIIQSFDAEKMTATVQVAITETINIPNPDGTTTQSEEQIPPLPDVAVIIPRAGGFSLTLPIQQGDECLLIFQDACYDFFWQSGEVSGPGNHVHRHDLSDAICIPCGISQPMAQKLTNYSTTSAQLRSDDGNTIIDIQNDQVTITTQTVTINASGDVEVTASGDVNVKADGDLTATVQGDMSATVQGDVDLQADGAATLKASSTATVEGESVSISGSSSVSISGSSVSLGSNTTIDGIPFKEHVHQVTGLGAPTGPPLP